MTAPLPPDIKKKLDRAARLEKWTIGWLVSITALMYVTMGSSQAMKSAWVEDLLSLVPPIIFLIARRFEDGPATKAYPYGFQRVGSLGFFLAAASLVAVGAFLVFEASRALITQEHPTIGVVDIFGFDVWLGWLMIAALAYSIIPPVILGRMKKPLAHATMDKILFTDADMNAADWQTGVAGILGIFGIALGFWWADAVAAGIISISILKDGLRNMRISVAELLDGAPRELDSTDIHASVEILSEKLKGRYPGYDVQVRESGRYLRANIVPRGFESLDQFEAEKLLDADQWRLLAVGKVLGSLPDHDDPEK